MHTCIPSFLDCLSIQVTQSIGQSSLCYTVGSHQLSIFYIVVYTWGFPDGSAVINSPAGHPRDGSSVPGSGRSPGGGHGHPLQHSCLEKPHRQRSLAGYSPWVAKSRIQLKQLSTHTLYTCQSLPPDSSHSPFLFGVQNIFYLYCVSISALQIGSSVLFILDYTFIH